MLPYGKQTVGYREMFSVARTVRSAYLTGGPLVKRFEAALADYVGAKHAVAFSSGTAALHGAVRVADREQFVTTPISFVATANAALYNGLSPQFVDIDESGNLDTTAACELLSTRSICAPVSLAGLPVARLGSLLRTGAVVIEDACHALGAYRDGQPVGYDADMTVFSFHPVKAITTGEGGAVTTNHDIYAEELRLFRSHYARYSEPPKLGCEIEQLGFNYRISELQCALGLEQLKRLDAFIAKRNQIAERYRELLTFDGLTLPNEAPKGSLHAYHLFVVRFPEGAKRRRLVRNHLWQQGIQTQLHYVPIPTFALYRSRGYDVHNIPEAQRYYGEALSLPIFPKMKLRDVKHVAREIRRAMSVRVPVAVD